MEKQIIDDIIKRVDVLSDDKISSLIDYIEFLKHNGGVRMEKEKENHHPREYVLEEGP